MKTGHTIVNSVEDLEKLLKQTRHKDWKDSQEGDSVKTCPSCGQHKLYRHGQGKFRSWTKCPFCSNIKKYPTKIRQK